MKLIKVRAKSKVVTIEEDKMIVCPDLSYRIEIPKRLIIKTSGGVFYSKNNKKTMWTTMFVDSDLFKNTIVIQNIRRAKSAGHIFVYGNKMFGINFDAVIDKLYSRSMDFCFYCDETLNKSNRTTDHLIPKAILRAYMLNTIENNTVPCCSICNSEKASLHPYIFREHARLRPGEISKKILKTLNLILISKTDPLC